MLVLSRHVGERIVIDDGRIVIEVLQIRDLNKVRIGIHADPSIPIFREEVQERIDREREAGS